MSLRPADTLASIFPLGFSLEMGWLIALLSCDTPEKLRGDSQRQPRRDLLAHTRPIKCRQSDSNSCPWCSEGTKQFSSAAWGTSVPLQPCCSERSHLNAVGGARSSRSHSQASGTPRTRHQGPREPGIWDSHPPHPPQVLLHLRHHRPRLPSPDRLPAGV